MKNPNSKNGQAIIFTRQHITSLEEIERHGRFINKESYIRDKFTDIADFFIERYNWFVKAANEKVPAPSDVEFPIWCAVDFRNCLRPIEGELVYVLDIPEENIIYFDGSKWDYVLNNHYVPLDRDDLNLYYEYLDRRGLRDLAFNFFDDKNKKFYPLEYKKIIDSRKNVFTIHEWNIFSVQANIWEIKKEWIKDILY